jgi:hypothetical protein
MASADNNQVSLLRAAGAMRPPMAGLGAAVMAGALGIGAPGFGAPEVSAAAPSTELRSSALQPEFGGGPDRLLERVERVRRAHAERGLPALDEAIQLAQFSNWSKSGGN